jgi:hypothetical protein
MRTILIAAALLSAVFVAACGSGDPGVAGVEPDAGRLYEANATVLQQGDGMESPSHGPELCLGGVAESLPPQCGGVPIANWDWDAVEGEESVSGTTWGDFHVVGTYDGEVFIVTDVGPYAPREAVFGGERDFTTACPEPEGGWVAPDPSRASDADFSAGASVAAERPDYVTLWVDYAGDHTPEELDALLAEGKPVLQIMNVVVTDDVAGAEAAVREVWGGPLCVTQREGPTEDELVAIRQEAERFIQEELALQMTWSSEGPLGRAAAEVGVVVDPGGDGQAALDERYGPGVVRLFPALRPVQ